MRRKLDPMFRRPTKEHKSWLRAVAASLEGKPSPLIDFGITSKRVEILCDMGLVYYDGLYKLTEKGKQIIAN
jgi:hypothetical protein